ncbi:MAG: hypothetical protein RL213_1938 [Bacteroidota bacterium]|jgi:uncharacterized membrane protein YjfL (UPF0719 family)
MNYSILLQAVIAFIMGVSSLFLVYKLLNIYLKRVFKIVDINTAYATLQVGILLSTALLIAAIVGPGMNAIRFINQNDINFNTVSTSLGYIIMFLLIGMIFSMVVIAGGIIVLFQLTQVNEWEEIKNNNIATALISAALILGLALIMRDHVSSVCEMLVPYPEVLNIR